MWITPKRIYLRAPFYLLLEDTRISFSQSTSHNNVFLGFYMQQRYFMQGHVVPQRQYILLVGFSIPITPAAQNSYKWTLFFFLKRYCFLHFFSRNMWGLCWIIKNQPLPICLVMQLVPNRIGCVLLNYSAESKCSRSLCCSSKTRPQSREFIQM